MRTPISMQFASKCFVFQILLDKIQLYFCDPFSLIIFPVEYNGTIYIWNRCLLVMCNFKTLTPNDAKPHFLMENPPEKPFSRESFPCNALNKFLIWLRRNIYTTVIFPASVLYGNIRWIMFLGEHNSIGFLCQKSRLGNITVVHVYIYRRSQMRNIINALQGENFPGKGFLLGGGVFHQKMELGIFSGKCLQLLRY